ncbi:MAG: hypothetical protein ACXVX5_01100 [Mycobacterium sp.]
MLDQPDPNFNIVTP